MRFTDIFIQRPVLAISISLLIILLGVRSLSNMPLRQYPKITHSVINVNTEYRGASADLMQGFVTSPLEQAIAQADHIDYITSNSSPGFSSISIHMVLNTRPESALADILAKVNSVRYQLPSGIQDPVISSSVGSSTSLIYISFTSNELSASQITDYLNRIIKPNLLTISGVAKVNLFGGADFAMRIWLNPLKMAAHGITGEEIKKALIANNIESAPGRFNNYFISMNIKAETQVDTVKQMQHLIIRSNNDGSVLRLGEIAKVSLSRESDSVRAAANGESTVVLAIDPTPTTNPLNMVAQVKKQLTLFKKTIPSAIKMRILYDATAAINESIYEVIKTIIEAAIVVMIMITLFLGSLRAVIIPIITIPLSLIGTFFMMSLLGVTLNLLTLLAMVLAIGLVVDDAIVVVENVDRHIRQGANSFKAAIYGTREIALPIISMTLTVAAVYSPIALMGGVTGALFKEFAFTLSGAVLISGILALTLSPMMCSKLLQPHKNINLFEKNVKRMLNWISDRYRKILQHLMFNRKVVIACAILIFAALPVMFQYIPSELAPSEDRGAFIMLGQAPENANIDYVYAGMNEAMKAIKEHVPNMQTTIALSGIPEKNSGLAVALLDVWSKRKNSQKEIIFQTSKQLENIPTIAVSAFPFPELPGASGGFPVQFVITTPNNFINLFKTAHRVEQMLKSSGYFFITNLNLKFNSATAIINIDRNKAGAYGITMQQIGTLLSTMLNDGYINRVDLDGKAYDVIPQVAREYRFSPENLGDYYVKSNSGAMIPLRSFVKIAVQGEPRALPHFNQVNAATISMVPIPGVTMGQTVDFIKMNAVKMLPSNYRYDFLGQSRQYIKEGNSLFITFFLAICIIFLVLASQFESMRDPIVILLNVPLAISGALLCMTWGLASMNIYTQVGLITLIALISRHGILICEVAKEQQIKHGKNRVDAVIYAANLRLRAILMTTFSMLAGLLPLLFAVGPGAISRFGIGIVIVFGLGIGTLFTLFVLPVLYSLIASKHQPIAAIN